MSKSTPDPVDDLIVIVQRMRKIAQEWVSPPKVTMPEPEDVETPSPEHSRTTPYLRNTTLAHVVARHEMGISVDSDVSFLLVMVDKLRDMPSADLPGVAESDYNAGFSNGARAQRNIVRDIIDGRA